MSKICHNHFVVVDMAYQGFATGDLGADSAGLKQLVRDGHQVALCQSFSKNVGLYGKCMCSKIAKFLSVRDWLRCIGMILQSYP